MWSHSSTWIFPFAFTQSRAVHYQQHIASVNVQHDMWQIVIWPSRARRTSKEIDHKYQHFQTSQHHFLSNNLCAKMTCLTLLHNKPAAHARGASSTEQAAWLLTSVAQGVKNVVCDRAPAAFIQMYLSLYNITLHTDFLPQYDCEGKTWGLNCMMAEQENLCNCYSGKLCFSSFLEQRSRMIFASLNLCWCFSSDYSVLHVLTPDNVM